MSFPRAAAPKRGVKTDPVQMIKMAGVLVAYTLGFTALYEVFGSGVSKRVLANRQEPPPPTPEERLAKWKGDTWTKNWTATGSSVGVKEMNKRHEDKQFPTEFKEHIKREGDLPNFDKETTTGSKGSYIFSRSKAKQAEVDAKKEEQCHKENSTSASS